MKKTTADKMRKQNEQREERLNSWFEGYWAKWMSGKVSDEKMEQVADQYHNSMMFVGTMKAELA